MRPRGERTPPCRIVAVTSKPSDAIAHLLREALEGTLAPNLAAAILFEALAEQEDHALPADRAGLEGFLTDRLRPALDRHLGPRRGLQILDSVRELLDTVLGAPLTPPRASQIPTAMVEPEAGPVRVLVVATKAKLANGLRGALGAEVEPYWAPNGEVVARILAGLRPSVVLIDGADPGVDDASIGALAACAAQLLVLVWAPGEPTGAIALRQLASSAHRVVALSDENAAELLVDYVRARRQRE